ncbi:MAG: hypothetical protein AAGA76_10120 [Pseudomonadota bacterium]
MHSIKHSQILHQIEEYIRIIRSQNLTIATGSDFSYFKSIPKLQKARHNVNPAFDPKHSDLNERNSLWTLLLSSENEILGTQAMQILPLQNLSLGDYLRENVWFFRTYGYDFDQDKTRWQLSNEATKIHGAVAYHGELWLKGGENGLRGGSMAILLTRLMILLGMLKWSPDFFIGLQSPLTSCRGLAVREGYMRTEQRTISWYQKKSDIPMEDWMVWMTKEEAEFNLRLPAEFFHAMFNKAGMTEEHITQIA